MTTLIINPAGVQGPAGIVWREAAWAIGVVYAARTGQYHQGSTYRARVAHTATAETEPGVGEDWETVWTYVAQSGELSPEGQIVSGIAAQIVTVAGVAAQVTAVAANAVAVSTVAADIVAVQTAAANIAAILAAPAAAEAAAESAGEADQAADDAEAARDLTATYAAGAAGLRYRISRSSGSLPVGAYLLELLSQVSGTFGRVVIAVVGDGDDGSVMAQLEVDGEPVGDAIEAEAGAPAIVAMEVAIGLEESTVLHLLGVEGQVTALHVQIDNGAAP